jgi:hypothetical protein
MVDAWGCGRESILEAVLVLTIDFGGKTPHQDYCTHNITFPFPIRIIRFILSAVLPSFKQVNERTIHTEYDT